MRDIAPPCFIFHPRANQLDIWGCTRRSFREGNFHEIPCSDSCERRHKFTELSELADSGVKMIRMKITKGFAQMMLLALAIRVDAASVVLTAADRATQSRPQIQD